MAAQFPKMVGYLDFMPGLHVNFKAMSNTPAPAAMISQMINAQVKTAAQNPQAAMFAGMINKLKVEAKGNNLTIDLPLNQTDVNQIKMMAGMLMMGLQGAGKPKSPAKFPAPASPALPGIPAPTPAK